MTEQMREKNAAEKEKLAEERAKKAARVAAMPPSPSPAVKKDM